MNQNVCEKGISQILPVGYMMVTTLRIFCCDHNSSVGCRTKLTEDLALTGNDSNSKTELIYKQGRAPPERSARRITKANKVRYFRVFSFHQSESRKQYFLASDWLKFETLPRYYRNLYLKPIIAPAKPSFDQ